MIFNLQQSVAPIWSKMSTALQLDLFDDDHDGDDHDDHDDDHDGVDEYDDYHDDDHDKDGNWCSSTIKLFDVKNKSFTQGLLSDIWIWTFSGFWSSSSLWALLSSNNAAAGLSGYWWQKTSWWLFCVVRPTKYQMEKNSHFLRIFHRKWNMADESLTNLSSVKIDALDAGTRWKATIQHFQHGKEKD